MRRFPQADTGELTHSDIAEAGFVFSAIYILVIGLAVHGVLFAVISDGYGGAVTWANSLWQHGLTWFAGGKRIVPSFMTHSS